jgi:hypothetical protein
MRLHHLLFNLLFVVVMTSCGKAKGSSLESVDCGYRYIAGRDCIVCSQGGVSCKW